MNKDIVKDAWQKLRALSAGDRSVLEASLARLPSDDGRFLGTTPDSLNDRLWSDFVALGWMRVHQEPQPKHPLKTFEITSEGVPKLTRLLSELNAARLSHASAMLAIENEVCLPFARAVRTQVQAAGGDLSDVLMLTSMAIARIVGGNFAEKDTDGAIDTIAERSKNFVRSMGKDRSG